MLFAQILQRSMLYSQIWLELYALCTNITKKYDLFTNLTRIVCFMYKYNKKYALFTNITRIVSFMYKYN